MIKNYFQIAWRSLVKNRVYSFINILGLAIGMAVVMLIGLWIRDELNYNKDFANYDRIVQVMLTQTHGNDTRTNEAVPIPLAADMRTRYGADFKKVSLASWNSLHILVVGDKQLSKQGMFVEPDMINILALRTVDGRKLLLDDPSSILISQSIATALFGHEEATGKAVKLDDSTIFKVAGVFPDLPFNSAFREVNYFAPWVNYEATHYWVQHSRNSWEEASFQIFALLHDRADLAQTAGKVKDELNGHGLTAKPVVVLHPMSNWHLRNNFWNGKNVGGTIVFVWMFGVIGGFVLLLACINFMNLSTARSEKRAKEVGIRKSVGSMRVQLIMQFLGESVFIALLSFGVSLLLVQLALPWFNNVADKQMHILWDSPVFWLVAAGSTLLAGLIAGSYPAFYLSSFNPVKVLKGTFKAGRWSALPRRVLIVIQFTVSVALIIGTIIVFQQILYVKNRPIGYSREGLITVPVMNGDLDVHYNALRQELMRSGAAANVAASSSPTTDVWNNQSGFKWDGKDPNMTPSFAVFFSSFDYGTTVDWQLVAGRDFSHHFPTDSTAMILNESAVKYMGLKNPIGSRVSYVAGSNDPRYFHVIGVVKDMVMQSPFAQVKQSIFMVDDDSYMNVITVKMNPTMSASEALGIIGPIFKKFNPNAPFEYKFNDDEYARKFALETRIGNLAGFFTILAIFISCLGLFGMASFMAEQRIKEIGVRKVLGASVPHLWALLSRDFVGLVGLSFFIAVPVAYRVMHSWLLRYEYRVGISVWVFVVTMVLAMVITLATVSVQAIRAAMASPVRSLRTE
jgi:ABC-type antimicrobial peptide transport system permease subunit